MSVSQILLQSELERCMNDVRAVLNRYDLGDYHEYLLIRKPSDPENYIVETRSSDKGEFAKRLICFHKDEALKGR